MFAKTSISAIRTLLLLTRQDRGVCWSPRKLAEALGESPTYLAKVTRHLVRSGILEAEKGVKGGVRLRKPPSEITLLAVVEACQGTIVGDFCKSARPPATSCAFHRASLELHDAITGVLSRWRLSDLAKRPGAEGEAAAGLMCLMSRGLPGGFAGAAATLSGLTQIGGRS